MTVFLYLYKRESGSVLTMQTKETITLTINVNIYNKMELIISNECIIDNVTHRLRFPLFRYMYEDMKRFVSSIEHVTCKRKVITCLTAAIRVTQ